MLRMTHEDKITRCMNVDEAKVVCRGRSAWHSVDSAYPHGKKASLTPLFQRGFHISTTSCSQFYYTRNPFRRSNVCDLCYENDCMNLDQARCDYYVEADTMLQEDDDPSTAIENPDMKREVDDLVFDLVDKARFSDNMECIPYVSRYTDCNKENVCLGCKICSCDAEGKWNCSSAQQCHTPDPPLNIDHRVLVMLMETFMDAGKAKKSKRSITEKPEVNKITASTLTLEQMSEWLYGVKPLNVLEYSPETVRDTGVVPTDAETTLTEVTMIVVNNETTEISTIKTDTEMKGSGLTTTKPTTETSNASPDNDYVAFDEVLRSIAVDTKSYNRRKLPLNDALSNKTFDIDYMLMDEDNMTTDNAKDDFAYIINNMQGDDTVTESTVEGSTKVIIDLLETAVRSKNKFNITQDFDIYNKDDENINAFENTNDIIEYNAANIMKRDVSAVATSNVVPTVTIVVNTTNTTNTTETEESVDLKQNVFAPLNKFILEKKKELEDLQRIRDKLLKYVKIDEELAENIVKETNISNSYFSIFNLAMPMFHEDTRRGNPDLYDKYMNKLKTHIIEVLKIATAIQKLKGSDIPYDLKSLLHAMKRYVYKNKNFDIKKSTKNKNKNVKNSRRQMEKNYGRCNFISFKDCIIQIVQVIDKNMPQSNALAPLSSASRKIMKHLIKTFYVDDLAIPGLRVNDPNYNFTNDVQSIGVKWEQMTANILSSSSSVTLYKMKLLHYVLAMDISKINDALALMNFAYSRRMFHTLQGVNEDIINKINAGLTAIHNKIQVIIRYYLPKVMPDKICTHETETLKMRAIIETTPPTTTKLKQNEVSASKEAKESRKKNKHSFIKHIRSLLKTSKKDIAELLHRKVPKSEIVKQLARKKLDELSEKRYNEYEATMKRWQKNLDLTPRLKRSVLDKFKERIKSIIPSYLRHKVNPRIKENKKSTTANATHKAKGRNNKRKSVKRGRKGKKTTTSAAIKSSHVVTPKSRTTVKATTIKVDVTTQIH